MTLVILVCALAALALGYAVFGRALERAWGVDPDRETPSHERFDGKDYVPAHPLLLFGHHFASVADAGLLAGAVLASPFGWLPVVLWIVLGGVFVGGLHDYGVLFFSLRHGGVSLARLWKERMGEKAQRLFLIFALLVLVLFIASLTNIVASSFESAGSFLSFGAAQVSANAAAASTSLLFILLALFFGFLYYRKNLPMLPCLLLGVLGLVGVLFAGLNLGINMSYPLWVLVIAVYIALASLLPVWQLLQPRDFLSALLLFGVMALAVVSVALSAFGGKVTLELPAFTGFTGENGPLFPVLFILVGSGAVSGFHGLIASGTTAKQLSNEKHARPIGYGGMLLSSLLAVLALLAVGVVFRSGSALSSPGAKFAAGLATMVSAAFGGDGALVSSGLVYELLALTLSVLALTSLDTACRLARYLFRELVLPEGEKEKDLKGLRKLLAKPLTGTLLVVLLGCGLGLNKELTELWSVFGAANLLLALLGLLAVGSWLGECGRKKGVFYVPAALLGLVTLGFLGLSIGGKLSLILAGAAGFVDWFTALWSLCLIVLGVVMATQLFRGKKKGAE